ncbi:MAG: glycosyltransferase [Planctomycetaceae bacterium]
MPEVSVVLPVFNGARTVARAVGSILGQTLRDIELIVVDDGSTDHTVAVLQKVRDPRLRLVQCPHRGVASTANAGTTLARAPVIARMDADDFAYPLRLEKQLALLDQQKLDVAGCKIRILNESNGPAASLQRYERWINEETIDGEQIAALRFVELPLVNPTILARRSYFELGFRHGEFPEDYDLMLRAAAKGMRFGKVDEVLLDWIDGPGRLSRTDSRYSADAFARCRQTHLLDGPLKGVAQVDLWGLGETGKPWLRWLQAHGIAVRRGYDVSDRKIGETIHGVRVAHYTEMPPADGTPLMIAVGAEGSRELILPHITAQGYVSGSNAWFVA